MSTNKHPVEQDELMAYLDGELVRRPRREGYHSMAESIVGIVLFLFSFGPSLLLWGAILFVPARAVWRKILRNSAS